MTAKDIDAVQSALDKLALALPDGFRWPLRLRREYEKACARLAKARRAQ